MKISALINTLNEEQNIENCLKSLITWVDEIIIVDMYSDDKTIEIAKKYTDKIFNFERVGYADPARAYALSKASNDWVVVLDADELIPKNLSEYLIHAAHQNEYDAFWIPRKNFMFGKEIQYTGWGALKDKQLRFFKKNVMSYGTEIHNFVNLSADAKVCVITDIKLSIIHFNYLDINHFIEKLNRYTSIEAIQLYHKQEKTTKTKIFLVFFKEFLSRYIKNKGYKDGIYGLYLSFLMGMYKVTTLAKLYLFSQNKDVNPHFINNQYKKLANDINNKY